MIKSKVQSHGYGIFEILLIIFVVLKLTGNIEWSWWWVLSPGWIFIIGGILYIASSRLILIFKKR